MKHPLPSDIPVASISGTILGLILIVAVVVGMVSCDSSMSSAHDSIRTLKSLCVKHTTHTEIQTLVDQVQVTVTCKRLLLTEQK